MLKVLGEKPGRVQRKKIFLLTWRQRWHRAVLRFPPRTGTGACCAAGLGLGCTELMATRAGLQCLRTSSPARWIWLSWRTARRPWSAWPRGCQLPVSLSPPSSFPGGVPGVCPRAAFTLLASHLPPSLQTSPGTRGTSSSSTPRAGSCPGMGSAWRSPVPTFLMPAATAAWPPTPPGTPSSGTACG